jgi:hypothetical protein
MRQGTGSVRWLLAALLALAALAFAACGGDEDETAAADAGTPAEQAGNGENQGGGGTGSGSGGEGGASESSEGSDPASGTGGDSGPPINKAGRDVSIQRFGQEADGPTSEAMAAAVRAYFGALAANKPARACKLLAGDASEQLAQLFQAAENAGQKAPKNLCKAFLTNAARIFSGPSGPDVGAIEFNAFRIEGERGFVLYKIPERPKSFIPVTLDEGRWKVAAIDGSALP